MEPELQPEWEERGLGQHLGAAAPVLEAGERSSQRRRGWSRVDLVEAFVFAPCMGTPAGTGSARMPGEWRVPARGRSGTPQRSLVWQSPLAQATGGTFCAVWGQTPGRVGSKLGERQRRGGKMGEELIPRARLWDKNWGWRCRGVMMHDNHSLLTALLAPLGTEES